MRIEILKKGDRVLNVTANFIAVNRKNGETDIIPITMVDGKVRVDAEHITTIGFGSNVVREEIDGVSVVRF